MQKIVLFFLLLTVSLINVAQSQTDTAVKALLITPRLKSGKDSTASHNQSSYFIAGIGIGNTLFGSRNNAINSKLFINNEVIYSPNISYINKRGFNVTAAVYYLNEGGKGIDASQYSFTPGYDLPYNPTIEFSIYNAHYFVKDKYSVYASPIQNDFYTALVYKNTWLHPGIAIDYVTGTYREQQYQRNFYDSITNKLKSFSLIPSVSHPFDWSGIFTRGDGCSFLPMLMLNLGNSSTSIQHKTNIGNRNGIANRKGKLTKFQNTPFRVESVGASAEANYSIGNFSIEPQFYIDYYLPSTDINRVSTVFTLNVLYSF